MYNINEYKDEWLTKQNLLKYVKEYDIYAYYLGPFNVYDVRSSPFRIDETPSFGTFIGNDGEIWFNDFKIGGGDCIKFVSIMEGCNYVQSLQLLNKRYNLGLISLSSSTNTILSKYTHKPIITNTTILPKAETWISIKVRDWKDHDKEYWYNQYEITGATLSYFDVIPISKFWINQYGYNAAKNGYAYRFDTNVYKIYQPYLIKGKWWSNIKNSEQYQGSNQLPDEGELLFITSSLKDVMVLYEAGFSAIAPHTEHQILSEALFSHYSSKWDLVTVLYDNDEAGILHADKMVKKYGIKSLILPESDTKDPSDFVKKYDLETLKLWIHNVL
jgi:hypothetical protein